MKIFIEIPTFVGFVKKIKFLIRLEIMVTLLDGRKAKNMQSVIWMLNRKKSNLFPWRFNFSTNYDCNLFSKKLIDMKKK